MFCSKCGNEIKDGEDFCSNCGKPVKGSNTTNNETIRIILHRVKKLSACIPVMKIYIDQKLVAKLYNGETVEISETYGTHQIILDIVGCVSKETIEFSREYKKVYIDVAMRI